MFSLRDKKLFYNKIDPSVELFRVNTIGDGSCFFHSVLRNIYCRYNTMNTREKQEFVSTVRKSLAKRLTLENWLNLGNGMLAYNLVIMNFVKYIEENVDDKNIIQIIQSHDSDNLNDYIEKLIKKINSTRSIEFIKRSFIMIIRKTFQQFRNKLADTRVWIGEDYFSGSIDIFEYVSDILNVDIYLFEDSGYLYKQSILHNTRYKKRPSIFILWTNENHYESLVTREHTIFSHNSPFVKKLYRIVTS